MRAKISLAVLVALALLGFQPAAWAQFTVTGPTGASVGIGQAARGGAAGGGAGTQAGAGVGGDLSVTGLEGLTGSERFIRDARQPGQFVGADTQEGAGFVGRVESTTGGRASRRSTQSRRSGAANTGGRGRTNSRQIRANMQVAFALMRPMPAQRSSVLASRFERRVNQLQAQGPVEVLIEDRTATLRGVVANEHGRRLAEQMARLEPGIWSVKNELVVAPQTNPAPPPAPAAPLIEPPVQ